MLTYTGSTLGLGMTGSGTEYDLHIVKLATEFMALSKEERDLLLRIVSPRPVQARFDGEEIDAARRGAATLTRREREVTQYILSGTSTKEIARILDISPRTVEVYRSRSMQKLHARNTGHLCALAVSVGLSPAT